MSILAFDMGGTSVKYAVWDGDLKHQSSFKTPDNFEMMKRNLIDAFNRFSQDYTFKGVAISAPGSVDIDRGVIGGISAIPYIHNFEIQKELEELFGVPVSLENDANSAALAELWKGKAKDVDSALFVVVGTGIGGAVIQNRKLIKGKNLFAGEFGIMMLNEELSFSMAGTAVHMARRYCERKNLEVGSVSGKDVFDRAELGDVLAIEEVNNFYDYLSLGIYNIMFTTDPDVIILGGGVTQYEPLVDNLKKRINARLKKIGLDDYQYEITTCEFLSDANLIGAVYAHLDKYGGL